jgi:hypothetical protein
MLEKNVDHKNLVKKNIFVWFSLKKFYTINLSTVTFGSFLA